MSAILALINRVEHAHINRAGRAVCTDIDVARDAVHDELRDEMARALVDGSPFVSAWQRDRNSQPIEVQEMVSCAVIDNALQSIDCATALMVVLRGSQCPLVEQLRQQIAETHAQLNASGVADARGFA